MTIKECYDAMGADYQNTLNRFPNEAFIKKFVLKFLDDNSYANLKEAIAAGNVEEAFRAAHTLKGVCLNLDLIIFIKRVQLLQRFFVQENSQELRKHLKKLRNSTI